MNGWTFGQHTVSTVASSTPILCNRECHNNNECSFWTFDSSNCYLKNGLGSISYTGSSNHFSGAKTCYDENDAEGQMSQINGSTAGRFTGGSVENEISVPKVTQLEICATICKEKPNVIPNCKVYTFDAKNRICFLYGKNDETVLLNKCETEVCNPECNCVHWGTYYGVAPTELDTFGFQSIPYNPISSPYISGKGEDV